MLAELSYLQRPLGLAYIGTIVVAVLMTIVPVAGLVDWTALEGGAFR